ncbi:MAG: hypothetical protein MRQ07_00845 [Candidatus Midichloria sp.]|nr:hypothetical protein [Candidatus Midichloria sp.]
MDNPIGIIVASAGDINDDGLNDIVFGNSSFTSSLELSDLNDLGQKIMRLGRYM